MLEQLFRTNEAAQSTVYGVLMATLASFFLSFLLVLTYRFTSTEVVERREFLQGMALISIVATMIMQAIGDSLARGLGMLGALSIIRFRTSLSSPRNMSFMFASLAAGIACGVFGFTIAFIGTTAFCLIAVALHYEFRGEAATTRGELRVTLLADAAGEREVRQVLQRYVTRLHVTERRYNLARPKAPEVPSANGQATVAAIGATRRTAAQTSIPELAVATTHAPTTSAEPEAQEIVTYQFRMRPQASEFDLLREVVKVAAVLDQRLRFTHTPESL